MICSKLMVLATSNVVVCKPKHFAILRRYFFILRWSGCPQTVYWLFENSDQVNDFHPDSALMIGDSLTADIQGGNNAGIDSIWFNPKGLLMRLGYSNLSSQTTKKSLTILSK